MFFQVESAWNLNDLLTDGKCLESYLIKHFWELMFVHYMVKIVSPRVGKFPGSHSVHLHPIKDSLLRFINRNVSIFILDKFSDSKLTAS